MDNGYSDAPCLKRRKLSLADFQDLPRHLYQHVVKFLPQQDLVALAQVSLHFNPLCNKRLYSRILFTPRECILLSATLVYDYWTIARSLDLLFPDNHLSAFYTREITIADGSVYDSIIPWFNAISFVNLQKFVPLGIQNPECLAGFETKQFETLSTVVSPFQSTTFPQTFKEMIVSAHVNNWLYDYNITENAELDLKAMTSNKGVVSSLKVFSSMKCGLRYLDELSQLFGKSAIQKIDLKIFSLSHVHRYDNIDPEVEPDPMLRLEVLSMLVTAPMPRLEYSLVLEFLQVGKVQNLELEVGCMDRSSGCLCSEEFLANCCGGFRTLKKLVLTRGDYPILRELHEWHDSFGGLITANLGTLEYLYVNFNNIVLPVHEMAQVSLESIERLRNSSLLFMGSIMQCKILEELVITDFVESYLCFHSNIKEYFTQRAKDPQGLIQCPECQRVFDEFPDKDRFFEAILEVLPGIQSRTMDLGIDTCLSKLDILRLPYTVGREKIDPLSPSLGGYSDEEETEEMTDKMFASIVNLIAHCLMPTVETLLEALPKLRTVSLDGILFESRNSRGIRSMVCVSEVYQGHT
ncbi:hypothetical protein BABINDRAFT_159702 [Babjeviella inositovora NRRL Y-12698]|uniref:F-box domain-containing protein n=1 Tax=Babjeviella inositovora NRRL Y-12698 TaxID=984486 RepID=A0A1E3R003_9ASCO|nr:uncharacterized protein BABINDRAFT_159702 [Babjeviella inositovora NRRL Y-12698]ODQ83270.1 hypothetical protein BABINDRAFT_159702 [Babjeviella inositovora NRRL Y-12698]